MVKKQGYERGAGPYSKVSDGKDKIVQGNRGDLPAGEGVRELDADKLTAISEGRGNKSLRGSK